MKKLIGSFSEKVLTEGNDTVAAKLQRKRPSFFSTTRVLKTDFKAFSLVFAFKNEKEGDEGYENCNIKEVKEICFDHHSKNQIFNAFDDGGGYCLLICNQ